MIGMFSCNVFCCFTCFVLRPHGNHWPSFHPFRNKFLQIPTAWQDGNKFVKCAFKMVGCCLYCFEKCVKYVSKMAYITTAISGTYFFSARLVYSCSVVVVCVDVHCIWWNRWQELTGTRLILLCVLLCFLLCFSSTCYMNSTGTGFCVSAYRSIQLFRRESALISVRVSFSSDLVV